MVNKINVFLSKPLQKEIQNQGGASLAGLLRAMSLPGVLITQIALHSPLAPTIEDFPPRGVSLSDIWWGVVNRASRLECFIDFCDRATSLDLEAVVTFYESGQKKPPLHQMIFRPHSQGIHYRFTRINALNGKGEQG